MNTKLWFWVVWWMLSGLVGPDAVAASDIGEEVTATTTTAAAATADAQQQQQQRRENGMDMGDNMETTTTTGETTVGSPPDTTTIVKFPPPQLQPPCGCQQTLTRVACSSTTMQYETYILARLDSLDLVPDGPFSADTVKLLQDNLQSAYNEIQNLFHCDRPYFREMVSAELIFNNDDSAGNSSTASLDQIYLNFKVIIQSHLGPDGQGPLELIALDGSITDYARRRRVQQQQQEQEKSATSSSPLIRRQRTLQAPPNVGGECTCPTALAGSPNGGFASEAEMQVKFNQQLVQLLDPTASTGTGNTDVGGGSPIIDEVLQLSLVQDEGGQCSTSTIYRSSSTLQHGLVEQQPIIVHNVSPMQSTSASSIFETVFIVQVQLQPDWHEEDIDDLVQMQMQLLQDSYNDEAFRNCDSHFRRIISTEPVMMDSNTTFARRKRRRHLKLQQTLAQHLGEEITGTEIMMMNHSSIYYNNTHSHISSASQQEQSSRSSSSSRRRQLFQPIWTSTPGDVHNTNIAMIAIRATVECLNDNCPLDKKALAANSGTGGARQRKRKTRILLARKEEEGIVVAAAAAAAGLRGKNATNSTTTTTNTTTTSTTRTLHRFNRDDAPDHGAGGGGAAKNAALHQHHGEQQQQRHLSWTDVMGGCYCPAHLAGTGDAPTNETLKNAINTNMQLIQSSSSLLVQQVTAISEVEIYDCSEARTEFTTFVSAIMVGDKDLVNSSELTALGDGFETTYNSIDFQTCDPYFRTVDAVRVFIPPQEDTVRRRRYLKQLEQQQNNNNSSRTSSSSTTTFDDKDNEQRMLQTTKKPFTAAYAVKGSCVGLCPKENTLFGGGFGTRQRERRDASIGHDDTTIGQKRLLTDEEVRSWIVQSSSSSPDAATTYSSTFSSSFQRGLLQEDQCTCATGSLADDRYTGPTIELMNQAYSITVDQLIAQKKVVNVDSVEIMEEELLCKCMAPVATSCAIPIVPAMEGIIMLDNDEYPCNLDCDTFDKIFGIEGRRRRQRKLNEVDCDHGVFVCPV